MLNNNCIRFDWATIKKARDAYVLRLNGIYEKNQERSGVTLFNGEARFVAPRMLQIGDQVITVAREINHADISNSITAASCKTLLINVFFANSRALIL